MIRVEPRLLGIERLRAIHIRHRDRNQLDLEVHVAFLLLNGLYCWPATSFPAPLLVGEGRTRVAIRHDARLAPPRAGEGGRRPGGVCRLASSDLTPPAPSPTRRG